MGGGSGKGRGEEKGEQTMGDEREEKDDKEREQDGVRDTPTMIGINLGELGLQVCFVIMNT